MSEAPVRSRLTRFFTNLISRDNNSQPPASLPKSRSLATKPRERSKSRENATASKTNKQRCDKNNAARVRSSAYQRKVGSSSHKPGVSSRKRESASKENRSHENARRRRSRQLSDPVCKKEVKKIMAPPENRPKKVDKIRELNEYVMNSRIPLSTKNRKASRSSLLLPEKSSYRKTKDWIDKHKAQVAIEEGTSHIAPKAKTSATKREMARDRLDVVRMTQVDVSQEVRI